MENIIDFGYLYGMGAHVGECYWNFHISLKSFCSPTERD